MKISDLYADVLTEDKQYEYKAKLNSNNPVSWAKTLVGYANGEGGILFVGVSNDGEAFGLDLQEIDKTKNLFVEVNDRNIFPHVKVIFMLRSVDDNAEKFVLGINVTPSESIVRYREGDFNETVYVKGDGYTTPATPEEIISLSKRKFGVDNESTEIKYREEDWTEYESLCREFRMDSGIPTLKELQSADIVSKDGFAKSGFVMFKDDYAGDDSLLCCRLWTGKDKTGTVLDSGRFKGSLARVFENTIDFIERNTKTGWRKTENGGREEVRSYPKEAIREALVNAIAHRDYSIAGTQIDVDIYLDRIDVVSPGSWLLPKKYDEYPVGLIPSIRRNEIIASVLDVANLMERGGTGFQTMIKSYEDSPENLQPGVLIFPGFLIVRLFDRLYEENSLYHSEIEDSDQEKIIGILKERGPKTVRELQAMTEYKSRDKFLRNVINPLIQSNVIYRDGSSSSKTALIKLK